MILSSSEIKQLALQAGFPGSLLDSISKIAICESGGNTNAHNTSGEDSRGIMQINVAPNANPQYLNYNLYDPLVNLQVAYRIYKAWGDNFGAWSCARTLNLVYPPIFASINPFLLASIVGIGLYLISNKS